MLPRSSSSMPRDYSSFQMKPLAASSDRINHGDSRCGHVWSTYRSSPSLKSPFGYPAIWHCRALQKLNQKIQSKWIPLFGLCEDILGFNHLVICIIVHSYVYLCNWLIDKLNIMPHQIDLWSNLFWVSLKKIPWVNKIWLYLTSS